MFETTLFLTKLIFDGTFDRFPRLKVVGAHGAGYLPSYLGRTEVTCDVRPNAMCANKKRPNEYLKNNIVADAMEFYAPVKEVLRTKLKDVVGAKVDYGTRSGLHPLLRKDIEREAVRIF